MNELSQMIEVPVIDQPVSTLDPLQGRTSKHTVSVLGVQVHDVTLEETVHLLTQMVLSGRPYHIMTVNPEFVMVAQEDEEFQNILNKASLVIPDGIGILWAARVFGKRIRQRVTGIDTVTQFARIAKDRGFRLFLLGAGPHVAERTAKILQEQNPGLQIVGTYGGSPSQDEEEEICRRIEQVKPHVLFVAYGAPKQDLWIARTSSRLRIPVAMGVGGTFDFIAGVAKRAPFWVRQFGFEWLYRLVQEPSRWRRMLRLPRFALAVLKERLLR